MCATTSIRPLAGPLLGYVAEDPYEAQLIAAYLDHLALEWSNCQLESDGGEP